MNQSEEEEDERGVWSYDRIALKLGPLDNIIH